MAIVPIERYGPLGRNPLFLLWNTPTLPALLSNTNVLIFARVHVNAVDYYKPPGAPDYTVTTPTTTAQRIGDWAEYLGYGSSAGIPILLQGWGMWDAGIEWGTSTTGLLVEHVDDSIGTEDSANHSIIDTAGIAQVKAWTENFLSILQTELSSRGFAAPEYFLFDIEPFDPIGNAQGWNPPTNVGWWKDAATDPKWDDAASHPLYEDSGTKLSLADAYAFVGSPTFDPNNYFFHANNQAWTIGFNRMRFRAFDYSIHKALSVPVRALFPSAIVGNYDLVLPQAAPGYYDPNAPWLHHYHDPSEQLNVHRQCPVLFVPNLTDPNSYPPGGSWGATSSEVYRNFAKAQLDACSTNLSTPIAPWVLAPGTTMYGYTVTPADFRWICLYAIYRGASEIQIFGDTPWSTSDQQDLHDSIVSLISDTSWTPDRRPLYAQACTSGNLSDPLGLGRHPDYITGGIPWVATAQETALSLGFDRFLVHMIQGHPPAQTYYSHSNWRTLTEVARDALLDLPHPLLSSWEIFTGHKAYLDNSVLMPGTERLLDLSLPADYAFWQANWHHWLTTLGVTRIWFDSASSNPHNLTTLSTQLSSLYPSLTIGGEAFPIIDVGSGSGPGGRSYNLDVAAAVSHPYLCTLSFFRSFSTGAGTPWTVPTTTEMHVLVQLTNPNTATSTDPAVTYAELSAITSAGFIVGAFAGAEINTPSIYSWISALT